MKPVAYIVGNNIFIAIGDPIKAIEDRLRPAQKYVQVGTSFGIYSSEIWTQEEILIKYPDAIPVKTLRISNES